MGYSAPCAVSRALKPCREGEDVRVLVACLALIAGAKLAVSEYTYRTATAEVIIAAYRERALAACQAAAGTNLAPGSWHTPLELSLAVGRSSLPVQLWQVQHQDWNARFRSLHVLVSAGDGGRELQCAYDISRDGAAIEKN